MSLELSNTLDHPEFPENMKQRLPKSKYVMTETEDAMIREDIEHVEHFWSQACGRGNCE